MSTAAETAAGSAPVIDTTRRAWELHETVRKVYVLS
jgi:uncharacterized cupin superfamily protein